MLDDRVECCGNWRQRAELFGQRITRSDCTWAEDGITLFIAHRLGAKIAVLVGKDLHRAHRKALGEVVDDIFARGEIDIERFAFFVGKRSEERRVGKVCFMTSRARWEPYH